MITRTAALFGGTLIALVVSGCDQNGNWEDTASSAQLTAADINPSGRADVVNAPDDGRSQPTSVTQAYNQVQGQAQTQAQNQNGRDEGDERDDQGQYQTQNDNQSRYQAPPNQSQRDQNDQGDATVANQAVSMDGYGTLPLPQASTQFQSYDQVQEVTPGGSSGYGVLPGGVATPANANFSHVNGYAVNTNGAATTSAGAAVPPVETNGYGSTPLVDSNGYPIPATNNVRGAYGNASTYAAQPTTNVGAAIQQANQLQGQSTTTAPGTGSNELTTSRGGVNFDGTNAPSRFNNPPPLQLQQQGRTR